MPKRLVLICLQRPWQIGIRNGSSQDLHRNCQLQHALPIKLHMQHKALASEKPDPPGLEYLLMTSVCQPHGEGMQLEGRKQKSRWRETLRVREGAGWGGGGGVYRAGANNQVNAPHRGRAFSKVSPEAWLSHRTRNGDDHNWECHW